MEDIKARRDGFDQLGNLYPKAAEVSIKQENINGLNCFWFTPENEISKTITIFLHGGVFALGSIRSHASMVSHFSEKLQRRILFVDYALAPENPFPAALKDVIQVYEELIKTYPDHAISFIGDSAGTGLIVSSVGEMLKRNIQLPEKVVFISGWINLEGNNSSMEENRVIDPILNPEYLKQAATDYAAKVPVEIASPENVVLSEFPPVLILVGTNEILLDDSVNFYNKIKPIQNQAILSIYENQTHVWPLANIHSEASQKALKEVKEFLTIVENKHLVEENNASSNY
ncbi:alpha/beta hydrolase [Dyadobacter frigoris]|uniref:Alpha/beta hydrolase n=1 Tax=Dyadobacter frigoris TaxID=2576211 RepID=A0A4U6D8A5_9BACT|nr:alpha/beta hydrolase [Dyadobacter frigoris]TKT93692.1 alpha/beta hydrolase [Dyadobacter frigoris]GLU51098.1 N-acetylphosphinothricin-tripetide-deacetylase [Dyadobacter frigoris]